MKKGNLYKTFLIIGLVAVLVFAITTLIDSFGPGIKIAVFNKSKTWLLVATAYSIVVLLFDEIIGKKG